MMIWQDKIDPELIDLFLDRIFQICNHSLMGMESIIADIGLSGNFNLLCLCDNCSRVEEAEKKEVEMEDEMDNLLVEMDKLDKRIKDLKDDFTTLKNNSVIFSLDVVDMEEGEEDYGF